MNKTNNLKLNVWEKSDPILVGDFNEDNRKIDAAVGALTAGAVKIAVGSYNGNGSTTTPNEITLGFQPKVMLIMQSADSFTTAAVFITRDAPYKFPGSSTTGAEITETGFLVRQRQSGGSNITPYTNLNYTTYHYLAIG